MKDKLDTIISLCLIGLALIIFLICAALFGGALGYRPGGTLCLSIIILLFIITICRVIIWFINYYENRKNYKKEKEKEKEIEKVETRLKEN